MSNKKNSAKGNATTAKQPPYVTELMEKGKAILTASSRDELAAMVDTIPADIKYGAGAVAFDNNTRVFTLRIDKL